MSDKPSSVNTDGVIVYTDSDRVSVHLTGEGYRQSAAMDHWEGEHGVDRR